MAQTVEILLVDDDVLLRETLQEQLALYSEFNVSVVGSVGACFDHLADHSADLILLDVGLPDMDGREACRVLRKKGTTCPIIMLTASDTDADTILGLEAGANDYVTKPFKFAVLVARIRAQLRQRAESEDAVFAIGPYTFQPSAKVLLDPETQEKIRLTDKETKILKHLCKAGSQAVPRDELLDQVWGYNPEVTTHTLETHIYRLRQKMEPDPTQVTLLLTEAGGYRLQI